MLYKLSVSNPEGHFIELECKLNVTNDKFVVLQLPAWRPGRYELANYGRNIRSFEARSAESNEPLTYKKIGKERWQIDVSSCEEVIVSYEYFANQMDAGGSFVDANTLYVNPVNCIMFTDELAHKPFTIDLIIPKHYRVCCQLPQQGTRLLAENFDQLADSPFVASANLYEHIFEAVGTHFHFWFHGLEPSSFKQLEKDTRAYISEQVKVFGILPCKDFHFIYLILPDKFRHGVEHQDSTVIAMGPAADFDQPDFYNDLLAISSHELFHLWNIKRMRPVEMLPYDFKRENFSELGYIYEGITTYYGDLMLLRSGVWEWSRYANSLTGDIQKHLSNDGRLNNSLAISSFDTWVDGYVQGVQGRKMSIYADGLIAAWIADVLVMTGSGGKHRMDDVLRGLYEATFLKGRGYSHKDYQEQLEKFGGISFEPYFRDLIFGKGKFDQYIGIVLDTLGLEIIKESNAVGIKITQIEDKSDQQKMLFDFWVSAALVSEIDRS